eukprot:TRINITY_DN971_c0_g1_i1.p1 TRINITY_DN971_c0_g1~~TRINITY_DN971_c0_g1_i1.p1  ORF type:complete len:621 (+),score=178.12 TRINITY_DN971_c0_g1_i1:59-1864(+)
MDDDSDFEAFLDGLTPKKPEPVCGPAVQDPPPPEAPAPDAAGEQPGAPASAPVTVAAPAPPAPPAPDETADAAPPRAHETACETAAAPPPAAETARGGVGEAAPPAHQTACEAPAAHAEAAPPAAETVWAAPPAAAETAAPAETADAAPPPAAETVCESAAAPPPAETAAPPAAETACETAPAAETADAAPPPAAETVCETAAAPPPAAVTAAPPAAETADAAPPPAADATCETAAAPPPAAEAAGAGAAEPLSAQPPTAPSPTAAPAEQAEPCAATATAAAADSSADALVPSAPDRHQDQPAGPAALLHGDPFGRGAWDVSHVDACAADLACDDDYFLPLESPTRSPRQPSPPKPPAHHNMAECSADCFGACSLAAEEGLARGEYVAAELRYGAALQRRERAARLVAASDETLSAVLAIEALERRNTAATEAEIRPVLEDAFHRVLQDIQSNQLRMLQRQRATRTAGQSEPATLLLLVDGAVVRERAALSSRRVARLRKGAVVTVTERQGPRAFISEGPGGMQGWVSVVSQIGEAVCGPATEEDVERASRLGVEQLCYSVRRADDSDSPQNVADAPPAVKEDAPLTASVRLKRWGRALFS